MFGVLSNILVSTGKGGKNRRRGKNENESEKRELVFKEDGQGTLRLVLMLKLLDIGQLS